MVKIVQDITGFGYLKADVIYSCRMIGENGHAATTNDPVPILESKAGKNKILGLVLDFKEARIINPFEFAPLYKEVWVIFIGKKLPEGVKADLILNDTNHKPINFDQDTDNYGYLRWIQNKKEKIPNYFFELNHRERDEYEAFLRKFNYIS